MGAAVQPHVEDVGGHQVEVDDAEGVEGVGGVGGVVDVVDVAEGEGS